LEQQLHYTRKSDEDKKLKNCKYNAYFSRVRRKTIAQIPNTCTYCLYVRLHLDTIQDSFNHQGELCTYLFPKSTDCEENRTKGEPIEEGSL